MALNTFPCNPYPISTEELNKGNNDDLNARVATLEETVTTLGGDVTDLNSNKANQITIAPFFNAEVAYDPGDLVYYNGLSYRCVNAHEGEWDADDFAATTIAGELDSLKSGLTNVSHASNLGAGGSITIAGHDEGYVRLIVVKREISNIFAIVASEYWSDTVISVFGTLPDSITITKTALSNDIVITNNTSTAIAYLVIN